MPLSKVLVIEDDVVFSGIVQKYLAQRGYLVFTAEDGETGLELCQSEHPDVVLCDLMLPKISGLKVLENLLFKTSSLPVIVISASQQMADIREAVRLGAWDYLVKPLDQLDVLHTAIQNCLTRTSLEDAWERERWELDDHIDVLFDSERMFEQLRGDLLPHEALELPVCKVSHQVCPTVYDQVLLDFHRFPDNQALVFMAYSQGHPGQNVLALLVLKSLLNPIVRQGMSGEDTLVRAPHHLLERLNTELCHSRVRSAFDVVVIWIDGNTGEMRWSNAGEQLGLSVESRPDLALGIWAQASFSQHTGKLNDLLTVDLVNTGPIVTINKKHP